MPSRADWAQPWCEGVSPAAALAVPLFPIGHFTPSSPSAFVGPPPPYTHLVCMVTHATGDVLGSLAARHRLPPRINPDDGLGPIGKLPPGCPPEQVVTAEQIKANALEQRRGRSRDKAESRPRSTPRRRAG